MRAPLRVLATLLALGTLSTAAACSSSSASPPTTATPTTYYVSLGDSYSVGYQPVTGTIGRASVGYTGYVAKKTGLTLKNFGCAGATTSSIVTTVGCPDVLPGTAGGVTYPTTTQLAAAVSFLKAHQGHIGLITVSIAGNDVTACAKDANPVPCVAAADSSITTNVSSLAQQLRVAAGPTVPLYGLTYPDVLLGSYVWPNNPPTAAQISVADLSVVAFKTLINPTLKAAYASAQGTFIDVTDATGAYGPMSETTSVPGFGTLPVPVAQVCDLTWFCAKGNIHANDKGYTEIGTLIVDQFHAGSAG